MDRLTCSSALSLPARIFLCHYSFAPVSSGQNQQAPFNQLTRTNEHGGAVPLFNYIYQLSQLSTQFIFFTHTPTHTSPPPPSSSSPATFIALNYSNSLGTILEFLRQIFLLRINFTLVVPDDAARFSEPAREDFSYHPTATRVHTPGYT